MQTFVVQLASAISVLIAGVGLDLVGLDSEAAVQTNTALVGLRILMIIIPMIGLAISVLFFRRKYRLSDERMEQILSEISEREQAAIKIKENSEQVS